MARCQYCFTECRTEYNIAIRTCSKCQASWKRRSRFIAIKNSDVSQTRSLKSQNKSFENPLTLEKHLEQLREKHKETMEELKKMNAEFDEWLKNLKTNL